MKADPAKLGKVWTSLHACMEQILLCGGENNYKLPQLGNGQGCMGGSANPPAVPDLQGGLGEGKGGTRCGRGARGSLLQGGRGRLLRRKGGPWAKVLLLRSRGGGAPRVSAVVIHYFGRMMLCMCGRKAHFCVLPPFLTR